MNRILDKIKGWSIVWQITVIFAVIMIIPALLVSRSFYQRFEDSLIEQSSRQLQEDILFMRSVMDKNVESANSLLNQLSFRQEFSYFLDAHNQLSQREIDQFMSSVQKELLEVRYIYPNRFSMVAFFSSNTQLAGNHNWAFYMSDLEKTGYYPELLESPDITFVGDVRKREIEIAVPYMATPADQGDLVLPIYRKILNLSTHKWIGALEINIPLFKLMEDSRFDEYQQSSSYFLFDRKGNLIYQAGHPADIDFSNIDFDQQTEIVDATLISGRFLLTYERCPNTNLIRAVAINRKDALAPADGMLPLFAALAVAAMFSIMAVTYFFMRLLLRRLGEMDKKMVQIKEGNFDVQIDEDGFNEISRIAGSFNSMAGQLQSVMQKQLEEEKAKRKAELRALQAQINPHFLYNTLENMRMQCEVDEYYKMGDSLEALSVLLRYSINWDGPTVTLEQEWNSLQSYISIMRMRFDTSLHCHMYCDKELYEIPVPKFILQPVLENSFNYGFESMLPPWKLTVDIYLEGNTLIARLSDNGAGIRPERLTEIKECLNKGISIPNTLKKRRSIGLSNVAQRIEMLCPKGSSFCIDSELGKGTTITICIVIERAEEEDGHV